MNKQQDISVTPDQALLQDAAASFRTLYINYHACYRKILQSAGLPLGGAQAILSVIHEQQPCSLTAICEILSITKGSCSIMVDKLVKEGLVSRRQREDNRRSVVISLTALGEEVASEELNKELQCIINDFTSLESNELQEIISIASVMEDLLFKVRNA